MNILLVRLRLIGDVVFTTPLVAALRQVYPDARLTYLVEPSAAPVVAHNPHLTQVITVPHQRGWRRLRDDLQVGRRLRADRFDIAIDLHGGPRSAWLTWASRAPVRVGYDVPGRSWMYTRVVTRPRGYRPRHAVENQWDLISAVNSAIPASPSRERHPVEMAVGAAGALSMRKALASLGIPARVRPVLVHVSAGNPFRRWPESSFAALAAHLVGHRQDRWVLVTAGPSDRDAATRVVTAARQLVADAGSRIVLADNLTLEQLRSVCDHAALYVGGDSGPLHIAATSGAPIVGLYGPTLPERSAPWRPAVFPTSSVEPDPLPCRPCDQRVCVPGDFRCLTGIDVGRVQAAAEHLLETR